MSKKLNEKRIKYKLYCLFKASKENFRWKIDEMQLDKRLEVLNKTKLKKHYPSV